MRAAPQRQDPTPTANVRRELRKILAEVDKQDLSAEQKAMVRKAIEQASAKVLTATPPPPPMPAAAPTPAARRIEGGPGAGGMMVLRSSDSAAPSRPVATKKEPAAKETEEVFEIVLKEAGEKQGDGPRKILWRTMEGAPSAGGATEMRRGDAKEAGKRRVFRMEDGKAIAIEGGEVGEFRVVDGLPVEVRSDKSKQPMVFQLEGGRGIAVQSAGPELRIVESKPVEVQVEVEKPRVEVVRKRMAEQQAEVAEQLEQLSRELRSVRERAAEARERAEDARRRAEAERAKAVEARGRDARPSGQEAELRAMVEQMRAEMKELRVMLQRMQRQQSDKDEARGR